MYEKIKEHTRTGTYMNRNGKYNKRKDREITENTRQKESNIIQAHQREASRKCE